MSRAEERGQAAGHDWLAAHGETADAEQYRRRLRAIRRSQAEAHPDRGGNRRARRNAEYGVIARAALGPLAAQSREAAR